VIGNAVKVMRLATGEESEELPEEAARKCGLRGGKARQGTIAKAASRDRTYGRSGALEEGEGLGGVTLMGINGEAHGNI
jgi:hypothetical protein